MTTVGRWSPNKVRARVLDGTWVSAEELGGMVLLTPTSIAYTGTSASIGTNGSVEFSAVSSLSLNGVFSADYDNYMVAMRHAKDAGGTQVSLYCRVRSGGTDESSGVDGSTGKYTEQRIRATSTTVDGSRTSNYTYAFIQVTDNEQKDGHLSYFYGPYLAQPTAIRSVNVNSNANAEIRDMAITHSASSSYDGFTFYTSADTFSGLVSVYGLVGA